MSQKPTRYARLYSDGSLGVEKYGVDELEARRMLCVSDDDDTGLLEVEIRIIRTLGKPKLQTVKDHEAQCPTCGEVFYIDCHNIIPTDEGVASEEERKAKQ